MKTSYFSYYKGKDALSIAVGSPRWYKGDKAAELMPTWKMVKSDYTYEEYVNLLIERGLDPETIYNRYKDKVLLCWEKDRTKCHRYYLAKWIEESLNVKVNEYKDEKQLNLF